MPAATATAAAAADEEEEEHPASRLRILVPQSRSAYLVPDPTGRLQPGQCFFQPVAADVPTVIEGRLLMVRP